VSGKWSECKDVPLKIWGWGREKVNMVLWTTGSDQIADKVTLEQAVDAVLGHKISHQYSKVSNTFLCCQSLIFVL
jgi:hypothetical protein